MMNTRIYIKNMVCERCIMAVRQLADEVGLSVQDVQLGVIELHENPTVDQQTMFSQKLESIGFVVLHSPDQQMVASVKRWVLHLVNFPDSPEAKWNTSALLVEKIGRDYKYLRTIFKQSEGQTIEQYLIKMRVERAKVLIEDLNLSFTDISDELGYSSVAHFSTQFKKQTGYSPSMYRSQLPPRQVIDQL